MIMKSAFLLWLGSMKRHMSPVMSAISGAGPRDNCSLQGSHDSTFVIGAQERVTSWWKVTRTEENGCTHAL